MAHFFWGGVGWRDERLWMKKDKTTEECKEEIKNKKKKGRKKLKKKEKRSQIEKDK